ncbi:armadillo-type protein [Dichotomocladium elegans]|nr:armadillo-type protein [Dichotomocladium elegans]
MADLGFDFTDEHDDYDVVNSVFSSEESLSVSKSETKGVVLREEDAPVTKQHIEAQMLINGVTESGSNSTHGENHEGSPTPVTTMGNIIEQGKETELYGELNGPVNAFSTEDYADEYGDGARTEGFGSDPSLQVMAEEALADEEDELIMDESLTTMERIYMFNKSDLLIHRLLVAKELSNTINEISVSEAVNYVLPMVLKIAVDSDDAVRETFVNELDKVIMFYYKHAPPLLDRSSPDRAFSENVAHNASSPSSPCSLNDEVDSISNPANTSDVSAERSSSPPENHPPEALISKDPTDDNTESASDERNALEKSEPPISIPSSSYTSNDSGNPCPPSPSITARRQSSQVSEVRKSSDDSSLHIPPHVFAPLLIDFLLDQNSSLASLGQQCIVSVASELASPRDGENALLYKHLLDSEIFEGVVLGLMGIVDGKSRQSDYDDLQDSHDRGADEVDQGEINLAKMMCLSLISSLANVLGPERCTERCLPLVERMASDAMFYVRKEAAAAIGSLATVVDPQVAIDRLLPLYMSFSRDTIWHVRRSCVLTLPLLCGVLPEETRTRIAVDGIKLFKNDVSRNVRNTLAEVIGELIAKFLPEDWETTGKPGKVPEPLLEFFLSLGPSANANQMYKSDTDRAIICAYNFPAVVLTAGANYWDSHLKDTYLSLTKDYQIKVRRTFAYSLHEIARIIGPERTERDLVQIFALYLMDLDEVKQGVLEHLAEFLGTLVVSSRNEYIPILAEVWDGVMTNWRLRDILAGQLRYIAQLFDATRVVDNILPLAIRACQDEFAAVRETGVESFPIILEIVKRAVDDDGETLSQTGQDHDDNADSRREFALALLNHVMDKLDEFVRSDSYRGRLIFVQICRVLLEAGICAGDFASFFLPRLVPLAKDPVVNVRIATSRAIRTIQTHGNGYVAMKTTSYSRPSCADVYSHELTDLMLSDMIGDHDAPVDLSLEQMMYELALDTDADVRSFVVDLVDQDRLEECKNQQKADDDDEDDEDDHLQQAIGTPMQGIEGPPTPTNDLSGPEELPTVTMGSHNNSSINNNQQDEETMASAGTPMDCSAESGDSDSDHEVISHDEDGDETMTDVEEQQHHQQDKHVISQDTMVSPAPYEPSLTSAASIAADDKEKDEYVYLSKSMVHQDEHAHSTTSAPQSPTKDIA